MVEIFNMSSTSENLTQVGMPFFQINGTFNSTFEGFDYGPFPSISSETFTNDNTKNLMPWWAQMAWTALFTVMILTATGGNCIVIWIVIAHRRMRTVTNYFLVNLSLADLLLTTFNCIFNFTYMIQRNWPFSNWYCTISNFIANATVAASVFTLTGISCDRYLAIVHPLHPRMSKTSALITITFIWIASMMLASPCLLYSATITNRYKGEETTACILIWPDGKLVGSKFDFMYQIMFLIVTYIIPVILMVISYTIMGRDLWGSRSIGEISQRQIDCIRSKRKVVKMFILIVIIFAICWLPYHAYFLYVYYDTSIIYYKYTQHVYLGFYWFAMSNAMVNPLIYYWMNARFRQYFRTAICGWKEWMFHKRCRENDSPFGLERQSISYTRSGMNGTPKSKVPPDQYQLEDFRLQRQATVISKVQIVEDRTMGRGQMRGSGRWVHGSLKKNQSITTDL